MTIRVLVSGERACFTRPELSVERVSYDVPTPSACIGILEAIYRKPEMRWDLKTIKVLRPIRWGAIKRNETKHIASPGRPGINVSLSSNRIQRHTRHLVDVAYVIEADIESMDGSSPRKHYEVAERRLTKGQQFQQPVLGCREFPAIVEPVASTPPANSSLAGERDLGLMLHSLDYSKKPVGRRWYRPIMRDGVISVPPSCSGEVMS